MNTGRRVLLSFACVVFAFAPLFLLFLFGEIYSQFQRPGQLRAFSETSLLYFLIALPGWFIALPFVVLLKDAQGWRGWFILLVGTCIGPGFMLSWLSIASIEHITWQRDGPSVVLSLIISTIATLSYFLALKFAHRRSIPPTE